MIANKMKFTVSRWPPTKIYTFSKSVKWKFSTRYPNFFHFHSMRCKFSFHEICEVLFCYTWNIKSANFSKWTVSGVSGTLYKNKRTIPLLDIFDAFLRILKLWDMYLFIRALLYKNILYIRAWSFVARKIQSTNVPFQLFMILIYKK